MAGRVNRVKFPLKMKDGTQARTIEDLREHFDYNSVLEYYQNGKLKAWLEDRYYTEEAELIGVLRPSSDELMQELCEILGVKYSENEADVVSMTSVVRKNNNYERLKQYTADDEILKNADKVAFSQDELLGLLDKGEKEIYLCEGDFVIPGDIEGVKYIGVNAPRATIHGETIKEGIEIKNVICDVSGYVEEMSCFKRVFQNNPKLGLFILKEIVKHSKECPRYLMALAWCYEQGFGTEKNDELAYKYYSRFAKIDEVEGIRELGNFHFQAKGIYRNYNKAIQLWKEAASKGDVLAKFNLAFRYFDGKGIEADKKKGIESFRKLYENGYQAAISGLIYLAPGEAKINEALLYVLGGKDNLYDNIVLLEKNNRLSGNIDTLLIKVRDITKIWFNTLVTMAKYYHVEQGNITFLGDEDNAEKKKPYEDVIIVLEKLQLLDDASKNALETEFTVKKFDERSDTQDYLNGFDDILQKLKSERSLIGVFKTFQGHGINIIRGKNQIESYLEGGIFTK
jgi:hypothetical protein